MRERRHSASSSMAAAAMPLAELERWLQVRVDRHPAATSLPMLDGYVAGIVAGPVSMSPLDWICPLLAIDADAFNHGGTPEFAAISAVALRHNEISQILSTTPRQFEPMHRRNPNGVVDPRPWCQGFYAAMRLRISARASLPCCCPSCYIVAMMRAVRRSDRNEAAARAGTFFVMRTSISQQPSRRCANTGCRRYANAR